MKKAEKQIIKEKWNDFPSPDQKPTECPYCEKIYIKPCSKDRYKACLNFQHVKQRGYPKPETTKRHRAKG